MLRARGPLLGKTGDRNLIALLSLKLMLLAFFIVLTTMADRGRDRTEAVIDSVKQSFRGVIRANDQPETPARDPALGVLESLRPLLERIGRLFEAQLPLLETRHAADSLTLKVDLPLATLLDPDRREVTVQIVAILQRMATLLATVEPGQELHFEIDVLAPWSPDETGSGERPQAARLSALLARTMASAGLPADRLSAGLAASVPEDRMRMVLRFYETRPLRLDFAPAAAGAATPEGERP